MDFGAALVTQEYLEKKRLPPQVYKLLYFMIIDKRIFNQFFKYSYIIVTNRVNI